ncbi:MAG: ABC1 kinase family protein [Candidatus Zixiibacteriota bacterium]
MPGRLSSLTRTYRHVNRYAEIIGVLAKHGFGDLVVRLNLEKRLNVDKKYIPEIKLKALEVHTFWERIRMAIEELGPTFIKFGQIMSNRPDLLPRELLDELEKLQDKVKPFDSEKAKEILVRDLNGEFEEVFSHFEPEPFASASIAQVHKAKFADGRDCVVKIRRPGIRKIIEVDLEIMHDLARLIESEISEYKALSLDAIVDEFETTIHQEIDFTIEAASIQRFNRYFGDDDELYVPDVFNEYCSPSILVIEYIEGIKVSKIVDGVSGYDRAKIAREITRLMLEQIFEQGFYHADPHPGNIFVLEGSRIALIDFGMMGYLLPSHRDFIGSMIMGIIQRKPKKISEALLKLSRTNDFDNREKFEHEVSLLIDEYRDLPLKRLKLGKLMRDNLDLLTQHNLVVPPDFYILIKALVTMEGICRKLDPDFTVIKYIEPHAKRIVKEQMGIEKTFNEVLDSFKKLVDFIHKIPDDFNEIKSTFKDNKMELRFSEDGLAPLNKTLEKISNRIAFAIVVAALIVGSSIVMQTTDFPLWQEMPRLGIIGFIIAAIMGFWLLISIIRSGKM